MIRHRSPTAIALILFLAILAGCNTNGPRKLTKNDLNEHGLISGSLTYSGFDPGETRGAEPTAFFTLTFRNLQTGVTDTVATGRFFDSRLIDEDLAKGDVYAKQLAPGDYVFEKCTIYFQQHTYSNSQKSCSTTVKLSSPFSVCAGEVQYLGELRFDLGVDVVHDEDPSWLFGPQNKEYLKIGAVHHDSFSRDIAILQSKYPEIVWQDARRNHESLSGTIAEQIASAAN